MPSKGSHRDNVPIASFCLTTCRGLYHILSVLVMLLGILVIAYSVSSRGFQCAVTDVPILAAVGTCIFATILGFLSFLTCIFRGKKRTNIYLFFVLVSVGLCIGAGIIGLTSLNKIDDRLETMWSVWSDDKKSGISEKFSCCLLREGTEDCPSDKKVPCLVILRPLFVSGDTLCSVVLFVMAGLLLIDIGVIIWTTRLFHRKKHQVRKDLEKDAAEESMSGAEAIRKSHKDKNLKKERKGAELKANSDS